MDINLLMDRIKKIVEDAVSSLGYNLWGIEYLGSERRSILRVYIDSPKGVSISDCVEVSKHLDVILDVEDPIPGSYTLEVSSPGVDRRFFYPEQLEEYIGKNFSINLKELKENRKKWKGKLKSIAPHKKEIVLETEEGDIKFHWDEIDKIKLIFGGF